MSDLLRIEMDSIGNDNISLNDLISRTELKGIPFYDIMDNVQKVWSLVMKGAHKKDLHVPLEMMGFSREAREVMIDMAVTRKRSHDKYQHGDKLFFTSEGLRWATPQSAAEHCSTRMGRDLVLDVTCGQGGQVLSLTDSCKEVIAVDLDALNCLVTVLNCIALGKKNVIVINGDCLDPEVIALSDEGCGVFSDPARPPGAAERTLDEIIPDPRKIRSAYEKRASGMCFEIPPYISIDKVDFNCEYEFISIDGRLNRLNIYTGDLISTERSVVVLPDGHVLKGRFKNKRIKEEADLEVGALIYEVDPAVVRAGLEVSLAEELDAAVDFIYLDDRRCILSTDTVISSSFLKQGYKVLAHGVADEDLISVLREIGAGSVTLRFGVDPKDYWNKRRSLEDQLEGEMKVDLFKGRDYLVLKRL